MPTEKQRAAKLKKTHMAAAPETVAEVIVPQATKASMPPEAFGAQMASTAWVMERATACVFLEQQRVATDGSQE